MNQSVKTTLLLSAESIPRKCCLCATVVEELFDVIWRVSFRRDCRLSIHHLINCPIKISRFVSENYGRSPKENIISRLLTFHTWKNKIEWHFARRSQIWMANQNSWILFSPIEWLQCHIILHIQCIREIKMEIVCLFLNAAICIQWHKKHISYIEVDTNVSAWSASNLCCDSDFVYTLHSLGKC